jgi:regulator of protease activity HflC (stomatin/prohibitin superfamily)
MIGQFFYSIPSGYHILYQEWGAHKGDLEPGLKMWWPAWFHITHIVTKGTLTYNAPTRQCPTADNIMVNVDLSLTFSIGPDAESVKDFCYLLGPARMDEYMSSQTEEAIRGLVFSVTHDQVNDLREEFAQGSAVAPLWCLFVKSMLRLHYVGVPWPSGLIFSSACCCIKRCARHPPEQNEEVWH